MHGTGHPRQFGAGVDSGEAVEGLQRIAANGPIDRRPGRSSYSRVMSFGAFLLRTLLCLGLLVNGVAQAAAATHGFLASHQARVAASPPCHEANADHATSSEPHEHRAGPAATKPDCCKAGCDCACSHGAVATIPIAPAEGRQVEHATVAKAPPERYASPTLRRLIRPPIV